MAWFGFFKKKDEKYRITLEDVRNNNVDIDYLIWKYKYLTMRKVNHSFCLFLRSHVVEATDTDEEINKRKQEFVEEIKKKPSEKREFRNSKTGAHLLWDNNKLIRMNSDKIDWLCLKEAITQTQKKENSNLHYWAYIYKLAKDGKLGSDVSGISVDNFREKMKTLNLNVAARNTIYDYVPRGLYPNYLPASKNSKKYNKETIGIQNFTKYFVETYYTILGNQVSLEEFLSIE